MSPTLGASTLLDRLSHKRDDRAFIEGLVRAKETRSLVLVDGRVVIRSNDDRSLARLAWFSTADIALIAGARIQPAIFLGVDRLSHAGRFAVAIGDSVAASAGDLLAPAVDLRSLAAQGVMSAEELALAGQAKSLCHWHADNRHCGSCGAETEAVDGGWRRTCRACGRAFFPRLDPVVIMLVSDGDHCVLAREPRFPDSMFSTLAGYVEPGEDVAHAVIRETKEEVGLDVTSVRFHSAQPWPFPHSLMLGCLATATRASLVIDQREIVEARWFSRAEAGAMLEGTHASGLWAPGRQAIAHWLIRAFVQGENGT